jgi:hypothetical protein
MNKLSIAMSNEGGVEEKKEDEPEILFPKANTHLQSPLSDGAAAAGDHNDTVEETEGCFQSQVQNFATTVLSSCGNALSFLGWPGTSTQHRGAVPRAPLSITEELRKLAAKEGRVFGGGMRRADIPRFLGEEGVYSFEDDNISAISQNTIEEMAKHGIKYPVRRKSSESSQNTPPPPPDFEQQRKGREHSTELVDPP